MIHLYLSTISAIFAGKQSQYEIRTEGTKFSILNIII